MQLNLGCINDLLEIFQTHERIILYGSENETDGLKRFVSLYGYCVDDNVDDDYLNATELGGAFVIICKENYLPCCSKLSKLGFDQVEDYCVLGKNRYANVYEKFPLDANIGYTYTSNSKNQYKKGVTVFGNLEDANAFKVVTLGSSTSDSQAFCWKCWSEILFERLESEKKFGDVVIYSASVAGYRSSQELLKLARDLLEYKPDVVISLSGVNDTGDMYYPFVQAYTQRIFRMLDLNQIADMNGLKTVDELYFGESRRKKRSEIWLSNIRMMHGLCHEFGIKYFCCLEPMLGAKSRLSKKEIEYVINFDNNYISRTKAFIEDVRKQIVSDKIEYIYDISDTFENMEDVYIDHCHVNERGSQIIAKKVYEIMLADFGLQLTLDNCEER